MDFVKVRTKLRLNFHVLDTPFLLFFFFFKGILKKLLLQ